MEADISHQLKPEEVEKNNILFSEKGNVKKVYISDP